MTRSDEEMKQDDRRATARRKLVRLLDRATLETLSPLDRRFEADRQTLEHSVVSRWPHDDVVKAIGKLVESAR